MASQGSSPYRKRIQMGKLPFSQKCDHAKKENLDSFAQTGELHEYEPIKMAKKRGDGGRKHGDYCRNGDWDHQGGIQQQQNHADT